MGGMPKGWGSQPTTCCTHCRAAHGVEGRTDPVHPAELGPQECWWRCVLGSYTTLRRDRQPTIHPHILEGSTMCCSGHGSWEQWGGHLPQGGSALETDGQGSRSPGPALKDRSRCSVVSPQQAYPWLSAKHFPHEISLHCGHRPCWDGTETPLY